MHPRNTPPGDKMPWYKLANNSSRSALEPIARDLDSKHIVYEWRKTQGKRPKWYICVQVTYDEKRVLTPMRREEGDSG